MRQKLYFILSLLGVFCFSTVQSQCYCLSDSVIYSNAYNYIATDSLFSEKSINVSNKLVGTCYMCFFNELKGNNNIESFYNKLSMLDEKYTFNDSIYKHFDEWFIRYTKSDTVLAFSAIIDHELFAEVYLGNLNNKGFGETVFYYFTFDLNGNIKFIHKKKMFGL